jgi:trk system potassium uptake protein
LWLSTILQKHFQTCPPEFRGRMVEGDPLTQDVLRRAGIEKADGIALVTNSDSVNAVIARVAQKEYGISNVVVRNYDPNWRSLYDPFGVQVVSSSSWGAQRIEELLYDVEIRQVYVAGNGEVEIYEFLIPAAWADRALKDVIPQNSCIAVSLTRAGRAMLPTEDTIVAENDVLLVSATLEGVEELRRCLLNPPEE